MCGLHSYTAPSGLLGMPLLHTVPKHQQFGGPPVHDGRRISSGSGRSIHHASISVDRRAMVDPWVKRPLDGARIG